MAHPDNIETPRLVFDKARQASNFQIMGWRKGHPFVLSGCLPVPVPAGARLEANIDLASKAALKDLLREIIAAL